jgi:hypothetical protein
MTAPDVVIPSSIKPMLSTMRILQGYGPFFTNGNEHVDGWDAESKELSAEPAERAFFIADLSGNRESSAQHPRGRFPRFFRRVDYFEIAR